MTLRLTLSFEVDLNIPDDQAIDAFVALHTDGERRARRQEFLLHEMVRLPPVCRAFAAYVAFDRAYNEITDRLNTLLDLPEDDLYHLLRPAIVRLPIADQEAFVDAQVNGSFYDETTLLMDGCDVRLIDADMTTPQPPPS